MLLTKQQNCVIIKATRKKGALLMDLIHSPYAKFKGWLRSNGLTYNDIADLLGLSVATVSAKINGKSDFLLSEIQVIKEKYNLESNIFFTETVA